MASLAHRLAHLYCKLLLTPPHQLYLSALARSQFCYVVLVRGRPSDMFGASDLVSSDFGPIDTAIQLLVDQPADHDIIASDHEQSSWLFLARLLVIGTSDNSLDAMLQREIGHLVAGNQIPDHASAIDEDEADFLYSRTTRYMSVKVAEVQLRRPCEL